MTDKEILKEAIHSYLKLNPQADDLFMLDFIMHLACRIKFPNNGFIGELHWCGADRNCQNNRIIYTCIFCNNFITDDANEKHISIINDHARNHLNSTGLLSFI